MESKYERIYHASINPFTAWEQGEKDAAQDSLWMPERCLLTSAKWLLPSRPRRLGLLACLVMLGVLAARCHLLPFPMGVGD